VTAVRWDIDCAAGGTEVGPGGRHRRADTRLVLPHLAGPGRDDGRMQRVDGAGVPDRGRA